VRARRADARAPYPPDRVERRASLARTLKRGDAGLSSAVGSRTGRAVIRHGNASPRQGQLRRLDPNHESTRTQTYLKLHELGDCWASRERLTLRAGCLRGWQREIIARAKHGRKGKRPRQAKSDQDRVLRNFQVDFDVMVSDYASRSSAPALRTAASALAKHDQPTGSRRRVFEWCSRHPKRRRSTLRSEESRWSTRSSIMRVTALGAPGRNDRGAGQRRSYKGQRPLLRISQALCRPWAARQFRASVGRMVGNPDAAGSQ
jgi:hypothetical protein